MLDISELLLDLLDGLFVAGVFSHVVAEFDGRTTACGSNFDDDVEGFRFFVACFVDKVIWSTILAGLDYKLWLGWKGRWLTGEECPDTENRLEVRFLRNDLVL